MRKQFMAAAAAAAVTLGVFGTSFAFADETERGERDFASMTDGTDQLGRILEEGEIKIAMEGTWEPWTYHDEEDALVGYDVEVGQAIADALGVKADFIEGKWDGLFAGLDAGRYDMVINGVDVTEERSGKYDFSDPYVYIHTAIIVADDNDSIKSFEDLKGVSTANTISSYYAILAEEYGAEVTGVDDLNQTIELLLQGRIEATLNAEVTFSDYMREHPDAKIKIAALSDDANHVAIPFVKGEDSASLREAVNQILADMKESGELAELSEKYFGTDMTQGE
jgi:cystine transport system substrate-binding protein